MTIFVLSFPDPPILHTTNISVPGEVDLKKQTQYKDCESITIACPFLIDNAHKYTNFAVPRRDKRQTKRETIR